MHEVMLQQTEPEELAPMQQHLQDTKTLKKGSSCSSQSLATNSELPCDAQNASQGYLLPVLPETYIGQRSQQTVRHGRGAVVSPFSAGRHTPHPTAASGMQNKSATPHRLGHAKRCGHSFQLAACTVLVAPKRLILLAGMAA